VIRKHHQGVDPNKRSPSHELEYLLQDIDVLRQ
jgi:hypothetical protein